MPVGNKDADEKYAAWRRRLVVAWAIVGAIAVFVLAVRGLSMIGDAVELLLMGIIIGFICSPITNALEDRRVPRALSALVFCVEALFRLKVPKSSFCQHHGFHHLLPFIRSWTSDRCRHP